MPSWTPCALAPRGWGYFLVQGVVAGISGYGSGVGVPTVGGGILHPSTREPLVNAMAVGLLRHEELVKAADVPGHGDDRRPKTGRDGIHGATFASVELTEESEEKVTAVQAGIRSWKSCSWKRAWK